MCARFARNHVSKTANETTALLSEIFETGRPLTVHLNESSSQRRVE
jgi:hypothetical protein